MEYVITNIITKCCNCGVKLTQENQAVYKNKKIAYCLNCWESF